MIKRKKPEIYSGKQSKTGETKMGMPVRFNTSRPSQNWQDMAKEIQAAKKELQDFSHAMSEYERHVIRDSIKDRKEQYFPAIMQGMKGHMEAYKKDYTDKLEAYRKATKNEVTRWDSGKLGTEMHTFQMRVDMTIKSIESNPLGKPANAAALVEAIYNEAQASGDLHKQRAAAEVTKSLIHYSDKMPQGEAVQFRLLVKKADSDYLKIRTTEEINQAAGAVHTAAEELLSEHKACEQIASDIGEFDPLAGGMFGPRGGVSDMAKYLRTVQQDQDTGAPVIYPIDAPEVTGINMRQDEDGKLVIGG